MIRIKEKQKFFENWMLLIEAEDWILLELDDNCEGDETKMLRNDSENKA